MIQSASDIPVANVDPSKLFRLPWTAADNAMTRLEPSRVCTVTCDGCPNRTYWDGSLVSACRLEEYKRFGGPMHAVPRRATARQPA